MAPLAARFGVRPWEWDLLTVDDLHLLIDAATRDARQERELQAAMTATGG